MLRKKHQTHIFVTMVSMYERVSVAVCVFFFIVHSYSSSASRKHTQFSISIENAIVKYMYATSIQHRYDW